jgi:fructose-1,6-bisphosphatase/inositol monophosphatase family enzyme
MKLGQLKEIAESIKRLHEVIRDEVVSACENSDVQQLSRVEREVKEDTIYFIDRISEKRIIEYFENEIINIAPVILIAEGIAENGNTVLPTGTSEKDAEFRIIMDPIDGTRELMYQKRSAWILTGIAPNNGKDTNLQDIEFAIQTEIPIVKQHLSEVVSAYKEKGIEAHRYNRISGDHQPINLQPSSAQSIKHGFAMIARFFHGARDILAQIDEEVIRNILGNVQSGKALCFEDQYLSTGGQIYELISGHDRFVADLRPLLEDILVERGVGLGLCCHPYDLCTELIAREAGVIITDEKGNPMKAMLNVTDNVSWIGYANSSIKRQVEPHLINALRKHQLL